MLLLYVIGFVAGMIAGISPCILPVLPVVLVAGATVPTTTDAESTDASDETRTARRDAGTPAGTRGSGDSLRVAVRTTRSTRRARPAPSGRPRSYRAYAVVAGLVVSFSIVTLVGSSLLSAIGLPQDFLRDAGLVVLGRRGRRAHRPAPRPSPRAALRPRGAAPAQRATPGGSSSGSGWARSSSPVPGRC